MSLDATQHATNCLPCKPHYQFTLRYFRVKPIFAPATTFFTNSDLPIVNLEKLIIIARPSSILSSEPLFPRATEERSGLVYTEDHFLL